MVNSLNSIMYNINLLNEKNIKVNTALSTGEAIEYGSDDSIKYDYILSIQNNISSYTSIKEKITYSDAYNSTSDDTLSDIKSATESIIQELLKANTATTNDDDRLIIASQLEDNKNTLISLANTSVDDQYIFSGLNLTTIPFVEDETTGLVSYESDNSLKLVNVEKSTYVNQGVNGIDVFYYQNQNVSVGDSFTFESNEIILDEDGNQWKLMDTDNDDVYDALYLNGDTSSSSMSVTQNTDGTYTATNSTSSTLEVKHSIFDDLNKVIAALNYEDVDGNTISSDEVETILDETLDNVRKAYDSQNVSHSIVGTRTNTINTYSQIVQSKLTNLAVLKEEHASADLTSLAIQAQALENTYTALYSTINRVNNLSLVNYLS